MVKELTNLIGELNSFQEKAVEMCLPEYKIEVNDILSSDCRDSNRIGYFLDFMLELAFNDRVLLLYRKLCRQLYLFDQEACVCYVNAYRERWDDDYIPENGDTE